MASGVNIEKIANAFSELLIVEELVDSKVVMFKGSNYSSSFNCTTQNPASQNAKEEFAKLLKNSINILGTTVNTTIFAYEYGYSLPVDNATELVSDNPSPLEKFFLEFSDKLEKSCKSIGIRMSMNTSQPIGTINKNMTDSLAIILNQLPALDIGQKYAFPPETFLKVVMDKDGNTEFAFSNNIKEQLD